MFFYLSKLLFSGFLPFKGDFVRGQKKRTKHCDWASLIYYQKLYLARSHSHQVSCNFSYLSMEPEITANYYVVCVCSQYNACSDWLIVGNYWPVMSTGRLRACKNMQKVILKNHCLGFFFLKIEAAENNEWLGTLLEWILLPWWATISEEQWIHSVK